MGRLIKAELRKMLFKKGVLITWIASLLLGMVLVTNGTVSEVYSDAFYKSFGYTPIIGLVMFMIFSGTYTLEYSSNMNDLINSTRNGKKKLVIAKGIGAGIAASITSLSTLVLIYLDAMRKADFKGLDMPLKELWYYKGITSNLNVLQMMIIVIISIIAGSFFFAQLGLYLSSISKSASMPFILGGAIMGAPYILEGFVPKIFLVFTPIFGMIPSQIIRYNRGLGTILIQGIIFIVGYLIFSRLTYVAFAKEGRR